jgi:hypothetical protein
LSEPSDVGKQKSDEIPTTTSILDDAEHVLLEHGMIVIRVGKWRNYPKARDLIRKRLKM